MIASSVPNGNVINEGPAKRVLVYLKLPATKGVEAQQSLTTQPPKISILFSC